MQASGISGIKTRNNGTVKHYLLESRFSRPSGQQLSSTSSRRVAKTKHLNYGGWIICSGRY